MNKKEMKKSEPGKITISNKYVIEIEEISIHSSGIYNVISYPHGGIFHVTPSNKESGHEDDIVIVSIKYNTVFSITKSYGEYLMTRPYEECHESIQKIPDDPHKTVETQDVNETTEMVNTDFILKLASILLKK